MTKLLQILLMTSVLLLTGCAATVTSRDTGSAISGATINAKKITMTVQGDSEVSGNQDWEDFRKQWDLGMSEVAAKAGISYSYSAKPVSPAGDAGTLLVINVKDYRYISTTARVLAGIMTGNAWLDVDVDYRNLDTGNLLETRNYQTKSTAWEGALSAMTDRQIESVCNEIINEIKKHQAAVKVSAAN